MLLRLGCQYPKQSDRKHPATVSVPLRMAVEALHHRPPSHGPPGCNMLPAAIFVIYVYTVKITR